MRCRHSGGGGNVGRLALLAIAVTLVLALAPSAAFADPPNIFANPGNENQIGGSNFTPNSAVTVSIFTSQGGSLLFTGSFPTDGSGEFSMTELEDGGVQLPVGRYIQVADGGPLGSKALTVVPLTFDALNPATDTASGTASANAIVDLEVFEDANQFNGQTTANGNGSWSVNLAPFDVRRGGGTAFVYDNDGDSTRANREVPGFSASPSSDRIRACCAGPPFSLAQTGTAGGRFTASSSVTMKIFSAANVQLFSGSVATGPRGGFDVGSSTTKVDLVPGMRITITDNTTSIAKQLIVSSVTFDVLDAGLDRASGTAPPGVPLGLAIGLPNGTGHPDTDPVVLGGITPAGTNGQWLFDGAANGVDITPQMNGFVCAIDTDGDCTGAESGSAKRRA